MITDIQTVQLETSGQPTTQQLEEDSINRNRLTVVRDFVEAIDSIRVNKELVTVFYDDNLQAFQNCIITQFDLSKNKEVRSGYNVTLTMEQVRLTEPVEVTVTADEQADANVTQAQTRSEGSNTEQVPTQSIGLQLASGASTLFGGGN